MAQRAIGVEGPIPENALVGALDTPDETKAFPGGARQSVSVERTESVAHAADRLERGGAIAHLPSQPADDRLDDV